MGLTGRMLGGIATAVALGAAAAMASPLEFQKSRGEREDYVHVPMPPGFHVESTELAGPVFADASGKTLYRWPLKTLRNGDAGEQRNRPLCDDHVSTETIGLMSPYPPGLLLPDLDTRLSCAQTYPPVLAAADAKPVGEWTIVERKDGRKQWAYLGYALYTSILDHRPSDVIGGISGTNRRFNADVPAVREAVGPPPNVPPEFRVTQVAMGRILAVYADISVYVWDKDGPNKSNCDAACLTQWSPVIAPGTAVPVGEWSVVERSPGIKQWAFRKQPLYTKRGDETYHTMDGSDVPGWHNVYTQRAPAPPKSFTIQDTRSGQVLADAHGRTIYIYRCYDDAVDELLCDLPDTTQAYRLAIGGDGDPKIFMKTWPYVVAEKDAKSESQAWTTMDIDPKTGHRAQAGEADALHVWAYNDRPVYTFYDDKKPGDVEGDSWGEFTGKRDGFKAFWLRDVFRENAER